MQLGTSSILPEFTAATDFISTDIVNVQSHRLLCQIVPRAID